MRKKFIIILVLLTIGGIIGYNYIYQDHRDIENEAAEFSMPPSEIVLQFSQDAASAKQQFLDKTIEVSGLISEINTNDLTVDDKVFCQFSNHIQTSLSKEDMIKVKGRVIGYDDLLEQVKLDQCTIIN